MRILVVGGGGREHALVHAFAASPLLSAQFCAPGNAGIAAEADCVALDSDDVGGLLAFAKRERIDLTVVGPESPLVAGITDAFTENGLLVFGPSKAAAQMEGSKTFAKDVMWDAKAPSARFRRHDNMDDALRCLEMQDTFPLVVKADGLAAGKGVVIANDFDEARQAVEDNLVRRQFGTASDEIIIEEYMAGAEVSLLALCDGTTVVPMEPAQDYKRIFAGDEGPNTGGMGSYCPVPGFTDDVSQHVVEKVFEPVLSVLAARGIHYRGVLYGGLIATDAGIRVLEFNCRFGDPETQAILPRLQSDLLEVCLATARGDLAGVKLAWKPQACVSVVMASAGYPASSHKGDVILGLEQAAIEPEVAVYHAGTTFAQPGGAGPSTGANGNMRAVITNGGRVLAVSALADGFAAARERAYHALSNISFSGMQFRPDIAERAVRAEQGDLRLFPPGSLD
jgi:phosphoribosylamine---glycine ligase